MRTRPTLAAVVAACIATLAVDTGAKAADINLMTTGAVEFILRDLIPPFEKASGHKVNMTVLGTVIAVDRIKPAEIQTTLVYATGIHATAQQPEAARALSNFLQLESSVAAIRKNGMVPAPR